MPERVVSTKPQSITGSFSMGVLALERPVGSMGGGVFLLLFEPRTAYFARLLFIADLQRR